MHTVSLHEITKSFSYTRAVDRVSMTFSAGEIHAVLGENGAGKSTLMHVLSGLYRPDAGEILIDHQRQVFSSPRAALASGIAMVHQHSMLVPTLTVAENIFLALPGKGYNLVRRNALARHVWELAAQYDIAIGAPKTRVATLSIGAQQRVELLKALAGKARVLILDEPTAVLTPAEVERLFLTLTRLKRQGYLILLITHKIPEVQAISDRLSVLRRGRLVATRETSACTAGELARLMIEEDHPPSPPPRRQTWRASKSGSPVVPLLTLENIWIQDEHRGIKLQEVSLTLCAGEVIGIAGVDGNGQTELLEVLTGQRVPTRGVIRLQGQPITAFTPAHLRGARVSFIPQDRQREGLALTLTIAENLLLSVQRLATLPPRFLLPPSVVRRFTACQIARFGIRPPFPTQRVATLSGGNQQRVVIARELAHEPQIIIAANPSRGLDVSATRYVHHILLESCSRGTGIVLLSTDLEEILALSDHIYTLYQGHLLGPVEPTVGREQIGRMMTGAWAPS